MLVGYNYPWPANRYITIGPNTAPRGAPQQWTQGRTMRGNFEILVDAGVSVIRIWLMGNGANYDGLVEFVSDRHGLHWEFQPPERIPQPFLDDFASLLEIASSAKVRLMPVLVDFGFFDLPEGEMTSHPAAGRGFLPTHLNYAKGRRAIASNWEFRKRFIEGTLEPLLKVGAARRDVLYAIDVFNEPWWCIAPITGSLFGPKMEKGDLVAFLADCTSAVSRYGLKSTIGHRHLSEIFGAFGTPRVDLPQHHYYPGFFGDDLMARALDPKPARILGEFGSITSGEYANLQADRDALKLRYESEPEGSPKKAELRAQLAGANRQVEDFSIQKNRWPMLSGYDQDPASILPLRLNEARLRGYEVAMIWPSPVDVALLTSDVLKLSSEKLESLKRWSRQP